MLAVGAGIASFSTVLLPIHLDPNLRPRTVCRSDGCLAWLWRNNYVSQQPSLVFSRSQGTGCAVHRSLTEPTQLTKLLKGERSDECPEGQAGHNDAQQRDACLYRAGAASDRAIGEW